MSNKLPEKCKNCPELLDENYGCTKKCKCMKCLKKTCKKRKKKKDGS